MHETVTLSPSQPNLVVGWAAGLLQVWPAEDHSIALRPVRRDLSPSAALALGPSEHDVDAHRLAS